MRASGLASVEAQRDGGVWGGGHVLMGASYALSSLRHFDHAAVPPSSLAIWVHFVPHICTYVQICLSSSASGGDETTEGSRWFNHLRAHARWK